MRQEIQKLLAKQVEGIIYVAAHERTDQHHSQKTFPFPQWLPTGLQAVRRSPSVVVKDIKGAYDLVSYIVSKGHKKIGVIAG
ncbi:MAG: hypothetical protein ACLRIP_11240 [Blautia massiliensis (ex Durand et al. 2017)]